MRSGPPGFVSTLPPPEDPPEEPTRPLPPATPAPAEVGVEREVAAPVEDPYRTELLLDQFRSLRTALTIVGVIAVAALGVAVYALLSEDEVSDGGAGANSQQVAGLDDRVDALEADVKTRATKNQVSQLSDDVKALSDRVDKVAKQSQSAASSDDGGTDEQARSSIDKLDQNVQTLSQDVDDLDRRVRDLEGQTEQQQP
jgi:cell division protein FtsB